MTGEKRKMGIKSYELTDEEWSKTENLFPK